VELTTGGGNMADAAGRTFRLHRSGRLEEVLIHHRTGPATIVRRDLPLASAEAGQMFRTLAEAGVVGSTEASILAGLQRQDPRIEQLPGGADCASNHLRIWSDEADDLGGPQLVTDLRFECLDGYDRFEWIEGPIPAIRKVERRLLELSLAAVVP